MNQSYDIHLAAARISPESIATLSKLGFVRDEFANLTFCHTGEYHATFKGPNRLPDDALWERICHILQSDERFSGYLEEEAMDAEHRHTIVGNGSFLPPQLPPIALIECPAGLVKTCDIHIGINLTNSTATAIEHMERLEVSSVDRPSPGGVRRVYTITCENLEDGRHLFSKLYQNFVLVPGLRGRIKLEVIRRHFRKPDDAITLPIATREAVYNWLSATVTNGGYEQ